VAQTTKSEADAFTNDKAANARGFGLAKSIEDGLLSTLPRDDPSFEDSDNFVACHLKSFSK
jgi:hypothetical protein